MIDAILNNVPLLIGIVVGAVIILALIVVLIVNIPKIRAKSKQMSEERKRREAKEKKEEEFAENYIKNTFSKDEQKIDIPNKSDSENVIATLQKKREDTQFEVQQAKVNEENKAKINSVINIMSGSTNTARVGGTASSVEKDKEKAELEEKKKSNSANEVLNILASAKPRSRQNKKDKE